MAKARSLSKEEKRRFLILNTLRVIRRRRQHMQVALNYLIARRSLVLAALSLILLILSSRNVTTRVSCVRSCRCFRRNSGWWEEVWHHYSDKHFKQTLRMSRATFRFILSRIGHHLRRQTICEEPISPEERVAICLYRLGSGHYFFTMSEMTGRGLSTVSAIVKEVSELLVEHLWNESVSKFMHKTCEEFKEKIIDMEELWQFPCCWAAIDGCHIPMKCPPGGLESCKEYHNFKNFYSIVLMGMVDSHYRFVWGSCGYAGNSHDAIILKSTDLWSSIIEHGLLPNIAKKVGEISCPPLIVGDSAFPLHTWLLKPFTNAVLTSQQKYFNYRLSRARMVTEGAYRLLKGRWRVLLRKNESSKEEVCITTLACIELNNTCIDQGESLSHKLEITIDLMTQEKRDRGEIRNCCKCESVHLYVMLHQRQ